jgi:hypothetical protein
MKKLIFSFGVILIGLSGFSQQHVARPKTHAEVLNETYCTGLFKTMDADFFDLLDNTNAATSTSYTNVLDWLQGRVAGLQVYTTRYNIRIPIIRNQAASVFVDEMWVSYDYLNSLPVTDIAMVKVIKGPFMGGRASSGAIAVYTIRGDDTEE